MITDYSHPEFNPANYSQRAKHHCDDPGCRWDGIAASLRRQSEFYAKNDRTILARD